MIAGMSTALAFLFLVFFDSSFQAGFSLTFPLRTVEEIELN